jgi:SecY
MLDLGGVRDQAEFTRRLAITAALLVAYRLGLQIPMPGIDPEALSHISGAALQRISVLALGITPFVTILVLAELLKVIAPGVRRWEHAGPHNRDKLNRIVVGLSLLAAAAQASGLVLALEDVRGLVEEPGTPFRLTSIATFVAGTALVIWIADQITHHGLGSGVWLLLVTVWLAEIPMQIAGLVWRGPGDAVAVELALGWGVAGLLLAAIVGLIRAAGPTLETAAACLWSILLANVVWPWLILIPALIVGGGSLQGTNSWLSPSGPLYLLQLVVLAALVALFAQLYLRSQRIAGIAPYLVVAPALFAGALATIRLAEMVLETQFAFAVPLIGHLMLIAVVALSLLAQWWQPPSGTRGDAAINVRAE